MRLAGKVALVSGAASGMGQSEATIFAREGAKVVVADILEMEGKQVAEKIAAGGGQARFVKLDVTSEAEWDAAVKAAVGAFGKLDVLVNNAGISGTYDTDMLSSAAWDKVMAVNAKGVFLGTKYAIPEMRRVGGGSIVNISSVAGIGQSFHQEPAYAASKGAIRIFTKVTASQHAQDRIRCNSVHPGPIDTEMLHAAMPDPAVLKRRLERVPLGRMGTVDEVVRLVLYLASDESAYMTGSELVIDGGWTAQ